MNLLYKCYLNGLIAKLSLHEFNADHILKMTNGLIIYPKSHFFVLKLIKVC